MDTTRETISTDTTLRLLGDRQRRRILGVVDDDGARATPFDELAAQPADGDSPQDCHPESTTPEFAPLYHVHLPKLSEVDVITWDRDWNLVRQGPASRVVASVMGVLRRHAEALPTGYLEGTPD